MFKVNRAGSPSVEMTQKTTFRMARALPESGRSLSTSMLMADSTATVQLLGVREYRQCGSATF